MTTTIEPRRRVHARANWGRWVADCATGWCTNAFMPTELGMQVWDCPVCGLTNEIVWPSDPISIEVMLLMRPDPNTRNWTPGETLSDLLAENVAHGCVPEQMGEVGPGEQVDVMTEYDGRIVGGLIYGPAEAWRAVRGSNASITAAGEPIAYAPLPPPPSLAAEMFARLTGIEGVQ